MNHQKPKRIWAKIEISLKMENPIILPNIISANN